MTDGFAAHEHQRNVHWSSPPVLIRYFRIASAVLGVEVIVLLGYLFLAA